MNGNSLSFKGIINYVGWVGHGNLGDEALYFAIQNVFSKYKLFPLRNYCLSGITLFGGGTLLPIWPTFIMPNTYNYGYGSRDLDPEFFEWFKEFHIEKYGLEMEKKVETKVLLEVLKIKLFNCLATLYYSLPNTLQEKLTRFPG